MEALGRGVPKWHEATSRRMVNWKQVERQILKRTIFLFEKILDASKKRVVLSSGLELFLYWTNVEAGLFSGTHQ